MTTYQCDDGNATVEYEAESPNAAAQRYVDDGEWGEPTDSTSWVHVYVWTLCEHGAKDGECEEEDCSGGEDHGRIRIAIEPEEPECDDYHKDHDWQSPYELLGGLKENPGVWGHGGGTITREVCSHCGIYRVTDTWAQDPENGEQGLQSVKYEEADGASQEWLADISAAAAEATE